MHGLALRDGRLARRGIERQYDFLRHTDLTETWLTAFCCDRPVEAAELLGLARTCGFNATAHHVLHGVVVEPLVRRALGLADYRAAVERGKQRTVDATFDEYAIG